MDSLNKTSKEHKRLILKVVAVIVVLSIVLIALLTNGSNGTYFALFMHEKGDVSEEVADWIAECDSKGKGVYVLKLPEAPTYAYCIYVYISICKYNDKVTDFIEVKKQKGQILEVSYSSVYTLDDGLPDYELSEIRADGFKINKLQIIIDGEEVEYSLSELK